MKDIKVGQYWCVKYGKFKGPVKVIRKDNFCLEGDGFTCEIAEGIPMKGAKKMLDCDFRSIDFKKRILKRDFCYARYRYLNKEARKALNAWGRLDAARSAKHV